MSDPQYFVDCLHCSFDFNSRIRQEHWQIFSEKSVPAVAVSNRNDPNDYGLSQRKPYEMKANDSKPHPNDGMRLKIIRRMHGKSQREIATELGVSAGTVANYEKAKTEIPLNRSRAVLKKYGQNPTPPNPEEDPKLLLSSGYSVAIVDGAKKHVSIWTRMLQLRRKYSKLRNEQCSDCRRYFDNVIHVVFCIATIMFWVEYVRRALPFGVQDPNILQDAIFAAASLTMAVFAILVIQSIPWGMKARLNDMN
ncbi:MAG: helix-turn-helix domain-containing protein [Cognatishimia sp.]